MPWSPAGPRASAPRPPAACTTPAPTSRSPTSTPSAVPRWPRNSARSFVATDVTDPTQVEAAVVAAAGEDGLRISVCCAGIGPAEKIAGRKGPHAFETFETVIRVNLIGSFNVLRLAAAAMLANTPDERGRARRVHQHRLDRGLRRPDRPGRLRGLQGRHRRAHAAGRARPRPVRHPRLRHRPRPVRHAAARRPPRRGPRRARQLRSRSRPGSAARTSTRRSPSTSSRTRCSTARSSAWTARCACRPGNISVRLGCRSIACAYTRWYSVVDLPKVSCYRK